MAEPEEITRTPEEQEEHDVLISLPKAKSWDFPYVHLYKDFWVAQRYFHGVYNFIKHFQAKDTDIILASFPKSGTTWLKALGFTIVNRSRFTLENSPLHTQQPHDVVPFADLQIYGLNRTSTLQEIPDPRILGTHVPYHALPSSIIESNCKIVYICRNPLDQIVSRLIFVPEMQNKSKEEAMVTMEETVEMLCQSVQCFGPNWDHTLGYRKASLEKPEKVLFLKYEDMKEDVVLYVKRIAEFLGCPFTEDEVARGVVEEISKFCSFENMKNMEVNVTGKLANTDIQNKIFFRKGEVGDWKNHLPESVSERLIKLMQEKLGDADLFKYE